MNDKYLIYLNKFNKIEPAATNFMKLLYQKHYSFKVILYLIITLVFTMGGAGRHISCQAMAD